MTISRRGSRVGRSGGRRHRRLTQGRSRTCCVGSCVTSTRSWRRRPRRRGIGRRVCTSRGFGRRSRRFSSRKTNFGPERALRASLGQHPRADNHMIRVIKGHTYLRWRGTVDTLAAVLRAVHPGWDPRGMATWARWTVLRVQRRYVDALTMLASSGIELSRDSFVYQPTVLLRAQSYEALGDRAKARTYYEAAKSDRKST